jgi:hypothetical protein
MTTIGAFMQPLVETATQHLAVIQCRAHFFRYRRDVINESWEAQGKLAVDTEAHGSGGSLWNRPLIHTIWVHGALGDQFTPLPPYAEHPGPLSPMHIDVRYTANIFSGTPVFDDEQKVDISVDGGNVAAELHNADVSINLLNYQTHSGVIIGALWFDAGYDWFWLQFETVSRIMVPIGALADYFKLVYEGGGNPGGMRGTSD